MGSPSNKRQPAASSQLRNRPDLEGAAAVVCLLSRVPREKNTPDYLQHPELWLPERTGKVILNSSYRKGRWIVTEAVAESCTRLHSKLAGSSQGTDPEAIDAGSAKVPLCEQRQSNRLMGYMIAEKGKGK